MKESSTRPADPRGRSWMRPSLTACGVVLGAGSGSRFGGPKQLAELQGRPLVQWSLDAACAATALERVVAAARAAPADTRPVRTGWSGRPGHPVALSARLAPQVRRLRGERGARDLIDDVPSLEVECDNLGQL